GAWLRRDPSANNREIANLIRAAKASQVDLAIVGSEVLARNCSSLTNVNLGGGSWQVYVQDSAGSAHSAAFTVQAPASPPTISGFTWDQTPTGDQAFNGTITGTNFLTGGTQVLFCVNGSSNLSESQLIADMNQVRQQIPANIPVATADVYGKLLEHP